MKISSEIGKPPLFHLVKKSRGRIDLASSTAAMAHLFVLEEDVLRVIVLPEGKMRQSATWSIAPGQDDVPTEGRDRFSVEDFSCPEFTLTEEPDRLRIETTKVRLTVELNGLLCTWELRVGNTWRPAARDRRTQAYNFGWWDEKVYHYLELDRREMFFGLGEKSGETNRAGRRFRMCNLDAMGYSAKNSDPLYKHIPFSITWNPQEHLAFGLFYDTLSECTFDLGCERDNYHGHYRYFMAEFGDLDYYFIAGPAVADVTRRYTWLTGRPALMPRWALSYSGSTMSYTDAPDAQRRMGEFLNRCTEHRVFCESFHLSSGYTAIGNKRYVFHWSKERFPDPQAFTRSYAEAGVHLCANIKPCLLHDHPLFEEARQKHLLLADKNGNPAMVQFWDDTGAYLDFTHPETLVWWKEHVKSALLAYGISSTWNDNNEFEIWSPDVLADGFGQRRTAREIRPLFPLLMMRASRQAQLEEHPDERPYVVTRSGSVGMHRYAQTWTGDNYTSWETLQYNLKMGLGMALSGISNCGHDVGGFAGPRPDPELFVRWVAAGIFLPRFSIHSWNDDQTANEAWMYPEVEEQIRSLMDLRNWLAPYLYLLLWRYRNAYEPVMRPTFYDFPDDPRCYAENDEMMLGSSMLVAPVVHPGAVSRRLYLPQGTSWWNFWSGLLYKGGQEIELPAPWNQPVFLIRDGSAIPVNGIEPAYPPAKSRGFLLFPPAEGQGGGESYEDDGESEAYLKNEYGGWQIRMTGETNRLCIEIAEIGDFSHTSNELFLLLPQRETRPVEITGASLIEERFVPGRRCLCVRPVQKLSHGSSL